MEFRLGCGHTVVVGPFENWLLVIRRPCIKCLLGVR